jgi:hypothetical protein
VAGTAPQRYRKWVVLFVLMVMLSACTDRTKSIGSGDLYARYDAADKVIVAEGLFFGMLEKETNKKSLIIKRATLNANDMQPSTVAGQRYKINLPSGFPPFVEWELTDENNRSLIVRHTLPGIAFDSVTLIPISGLRYRLTNDTLQYNEKAIVTLTNDAGKEIRHEIQGPRKTNILAFTENYLKGIEDGRWTASLVRMRRETIEVDNRPFELTTESYATPVSLVLSKSDLPAEPQARKN